MKKLKKYWEDREGRQQLNSPTEHQNLKTLSIGEERKLRKREKADDKHNRTTKEPCTYSIKQNRRTTEQIVS